MGLLLYFYLTEFKKNELTLYGSICTLVGGVFNLGERIMFGCVYDYIKLFSISYFNVSDALIVLGIILIICGILKK
ncbi:hypothetical protein A3K42_00090 [candidate division WWE3 bacterium RBG_13_37_7]|uniref:Uncharacterized protein n=1 Tax=candidate division WWE3 bacterium RBG_13_37_7 TaxID=1802609 RepID=A0A1F4U192_UNCKA|nr:MAG: hypothetical protein A3K42_00090 [candidate division WWE3 bacterium RBG_13_37_7]